MIRECCSPYHKGDRIFGEKPPYDSKDVTSGFCDSCFLREVEKVERELGIKIFNEEIRQQ
ncbi:MAG: hypothetical protein ABIJ57_04260 [Pseudomonadota bacterium]